MGYTQFKKNLKVGEISELSVLNIIQDKYPCAIKIEGKHSEYDLWIPELHQSVEVKRDYKSNHTGNLVVEVYMYGKPSGLCATKADWWVFDDGKKLLWIKTRNLKNFILIRNPTLKEFVGKGDNEPKKAYLIKKKELERYCKEIV